MNLNGREKWLHELHERRLFDGLPREMREGVQLMEWRLRTGNKWRWAREWTEAE
jgi:hypothetical protein